MWIPFDSVAMVSSSEDLPPGHLVSFWLGLYYKGYEKPLEGLKQRGSLLQFKFYNLPQPAVWKMECVGICSAVVIVSS